MFCEMCTWLRQLIDWQTSQVPRTSRYINYAQLPGWKTQRKVKLRLDRWMIQAYSRLSTTHGHITYCKLVCMYWTRLVLVRPGASLYSAGPLKHHPTGKQWCPNPDHYSDSEPARRSLTLLCWALSRAAADIWKEMNGASRVCIVSC